MLGRIWFRIELYILLLFKIGKGTTYAYNFYQGKIIILHRLSTFLIHNPPKPVLSHFPILGPLLFPNPSSKHWISLIPPSISLTHIPFLTIQTTPRGGSQL
jgi:hypothetical protein